MDYLAGNVQLVIAIFAINITKIYFIKSGTTCTTCKVVTYCLNNLNKNN